DQMFDIGVLDDDEVFLDVASSEKNEHSTKLDDSTAGEKLDAELEEEQKLARKQEEEANIALIESWENTQL
ncbi:hypothetical protein Tco_0235223, partial [Tanacetum coccineum]